MRSWDPTKRKVDSLAERRWQLSQSSDATIKNLEQGWKEEFGWSKDDESSSSDGQRKRLKDGDLCFELRPNVDVHIFLFGSLVFEMCLRTEPPHASPWRGALCASC